MCALRVSPYMLHPLHTPSWYTRSLSLWAIDNTYILLTSIFWSLSRRIASASHKCLHKVGGRWYAMDQPHGLPCAPDTIVNVALALHVDSTAPSSHQTGNIRKLHGLAFFFLHSDYAQRHRVLYTRDVLRSGRST